MYVTCYHTFNRDDFRDFAELCFKEFGDRVKYWITLNEPWTYSNGGYDQGTLAPGRCSNWVNGACTAGNSAIEPYLVGHHLLLSHAAAVKVYKDKYQATQKGKIGITLVSNRMVPYSDQKADKKAVTRALDFMLGCMCTLVGPRLPKFTPEKSMLVKGSFDFLGLNYYTANYAANVPIANTVNVSYSTDSLANLTSISEVNNNTLTLKEALKDPQRTDFYYHHLLFLQLAMIKDGVNVKGYFAWSLLDDYEWNSGYTVRFGIVFVDYDNGLKRYPKHSALWFKKFLL
ncbi:Beta-glucosidase 12 [Vitis vinifera]|uniref:Beta-glucosidase 12 n=1 Tax=Vitis vinifera TaxID=29760 RepID=A0A438IA25_VITVI|nr:Beta-glucosidase 12 [Vitis vinifera]